MKISFKKESIFLFPFASFFWRPAESRLVDYALSYVSRRRGKASRCVKWRTVLEKLMTWDVMSMHDLCKPSCIDHNDYLSS